MFQQGHQKVGGRKKGVKNKKTLLSIEQILTEYDINPIVKLIEIAESEQTSIEQRIRCWQEIAKYTYPKQRALDMQAPTNPNDITFKLIDA